MEKKTCKKSGLLLPSERAVAGIFQPDSKDASHNGWQTGSRQTAQKLVKIRAMHVSKTEGNEQRAAEN